MAVPEAAVDEDDSFMARQDDIRLAWQALAVKPEPEAYGMHCATQCNFRRSVRRADPRHALRSLRRAQEIDHRVSLLLSSFPGPYELEEWVAPYEFAWAIERLVEALVVTQALYALRHFGRGSR